MRLYLVRRTRSSSCSTTRTPTAEIGRRYLLFADGGAFLVSNASPKRSPVQNRRCRPDGPLRPVLFRRRRECHQRRWLCRAMAWAIISPPSEDPADGAAGQDHRGASRSGNRLMGFCPTSVQAAGKRRAGLSPVYRATHPAELRRPPRSGKRAGPAVGRAGRGIARYPVLRRGSGGGYGDGR